ncbi:MAG: Polyphosphate:AMP phosphotransferase [Planctomycetaceae bacterium]|nr:Polyphosphate:AMP phosphotransferase [Planctomycetaceae bacterium]
MLKSVEDILKMCRVAPGKKFKLKNHDPGWAGDRDIPVKARRLQAERLLAQDINDLAEAQDILYAADSWSLLVIFQAMDAAGKDGTIKHVMSGINPQGCQVRSFKQPSSEELDHDFLWRCSKALPECGHIGIFNRSYYEEVLVVKVHPELIAKQKIPDARPDKKSFWERRYSEINAFEEHLSRNGTRIVKFFLNVSKAEQRRRFLERATDAKKHWKFSPQDVAERSHWDEYMAAYEQMLNATSTEHAPWYVIPADEKWVCRSIVAQVLTHTVAALNLKYPEVPDDLKLKIEESRRQLEAEGE